MPEVVTSPEAPIYLFHPHKRERLLLEASAFNKTKKKKDQKSELGMMASGIQVGYKFLPKEGVGLRRIEICGHGRPNERPLKTFSNVF